MTELLRAKYGFVAGSLGVTVKGGQLVKADDPVVKGREDLFEPAERGIEQATRAPGEVRVIARRPDAVLMRGEKPKGRRGSSGRGRKASATPAANGDGGTPPAGGPTGDGTGGAGDGGTPPAGGGD